MARRPARIAGVKASLATVAIALLVLAGCGDDGGGDEPENGGGASETTGAEAELSSYETVSDLNEALGAGGIDCTLEYEGLVDDEKEISQCTIEGSQAIITIWFDEATVGDIVASDPPGVAYGQNWTVELTNQDADTAAAIADAAGGTSTGG